MEVIFIKNKLKCFSCGEEKGLKDFYRSPSDLYEQEGKMLVCKSCIKKRYEKLLSLYKGDKLKAFKHTLLNLDAYFDELLYKQCISTEENFLGEYFRLLATRDRKYKTSLDNTAMGEESKLTTNSVTDDLVDFWGEGYEYKDYLTLEMKYKQYTKYYPSESMQEKQIIKTLCELEVEKTKCRINGDMNGYNKMNDQISKKMGELDIIPSKAKKYGEDKDLVVGKLIEMIEKEEPIPDVHPEFNDIDRIMYWLNRYFIKPLRKVINLEPAIYTEEDERYEPPKRKD